MILTSDEEELLNVDAEQLKQVQNVLTTALNAKAKGDTPHYNLFVQQVRVRDDEDMVAKVVIGLSSCVSQFTQRYDAPPPFRHHSIPLHSTPQHFSSNLSLPTRHLPSGPTYTET
jgi:hypothetical protein